MIIYAITNKINGKQYVGQTTQRIERRWKSHCTNNGCLALNGAIQKYGKENFTVEEIYRAFSIEELNQKEIEFINKFNTLAPYGYNLKTGGNRPTYSKESREKMSKSHLGNPGYWLGNKHSEKTKKKISEAKMGIKNNNFGKPKSEETKSKMSASQSNKRPIVCNETGVLYASLGIASRALKIYEQNIRAVLKGSRKSTGGFTFSYQKE